MEISSKEFQEGNEKEGEQLAVSSQPNYEVTFTLTMISMFREYTLSRSL